LKISLRLPALTNLRLLIFISAIVIVIIFDENFFPLVDVLTFAFAALLQHYLFDIHRAHIASIEGLVHSTSMGNLRLVYTVDVHRCSSTHR